MFANNLYDEGVYLDKGGLTLIIKQDKSVTPLDYYIVEIKRLDGKDSTVKIEYKDNYDIIKALDIERGTYSFYIKGYKEGEEVCNGEEVEYVLSRANSTLVVSVLAKGHTHEIEWKTDETYHWKGCKYCSYTVDGTKEKHTYPDTPDSDGFYYCTECGRSKPIETDTSGFSAKEGQIEPKGHYTGTRSGTTWTFTFVDDNKAYPSEVVSWFADGKEVKAASNTLEITIKASKRTLILCVFKNDNGYGSYEVMIDGNWNEYKK